jgi:hypothetical protein
MHPGSGSLKAAIEEPRASAGRHDHCCGRPLVYERAASQIDDNAGHRTGPIRGQEGGEIRDFGEFGKRFAPPVHALPACIDRGAGSLGEAVEDFAAAT